MNRRWKLPWCGMVSRAGLWLGWWLLVGGCGGAAHTAVAPVAVTAVDVPLATDFAAAGDSAVLTVAVRPHTPEEFQRALRAALPRGLGRPSDLDEVAERLAPARVLDGWFRDLLHLRAEDAEGLPSILTWRGLDETRPVYVRLGEAPEGFIEMVNVAYGGPASFRHVLALPTTDSATLRADLAPFVASCEGTGNDAYRCTNRGRVVFVGASRWLFVALYTDPESTEVPTEADLMGTAEGQRMGAGVWALSADASVAGIIRGRRIRSAATHFASYQIASAVEAASEDTREILRAYGLSEMLAAYVQTSPFDREIDEWAFVVGTEPFAVALSADLTEVGAARWRTQNADAPAEVNQGLQSSDPPEQSAFRIRSALDLEALAARAPLPFGFRSLSTDEGAFAMAACGYGCFVNRFFDLMAYGAFARRHIGAGSDETVRHDDSLPDGTLNADIAVGPWLFGVNVDAQIHVRARLEGRRWSVGVASEESAAAGAQARAQERTAADAGSGSYEQDSLLCIERLGLGVAAALKASMQVSGENRTLLLNAARQELAEDAGCVTDEGLAEERDAYLQVFERALSEIERATETQGAP